MSSERKKVGYVWLDRCACGHWKGERYSRCCHCRKNWVKPKPLTIGIVRGISPAPAAEQSSSAAIPQPPKV